jgi:hypothetical protein
MKKYLVTLYGRQRSILAEIECNSQEEAERTYCKYFYLCEDIEITTI